MPNWCSMSVAFLASPENKKELVRLHETLSRLLETKSTIKNDFGNGWLGNVAFTHGFDYKKISCKGWINDINDIDNESQSFIINTETAWCPTTDLWDDVCDQYSDVSYVYIAEESCNGIYVNTDQTGKIFPDRYIVDFACFDFSKPLPTDLFCEGIKAEEVFDERQYFSSFQELQEHMKRLTGKDFCTVKQMEEYLTKALIAYKGDENSIVTIHEFDYE